MSKRRIVKVAKVTRAAVDAAAAAYRIAAEGVEDASATFGKALAAFFPSKGKGKIRVPKEESAAIGETAGIGKDRIRGLLAFGDWLLAGNSGNERAFRDSRKGPKGKGKGGRNAKSPAARIADILAKVDPSEIDAVLEEARDIAAALTVVDDDGDDDAGQ
jgi:hypothetical protein